MLQAAECRGAVPVTAALAAAARLAAAATTAACPLLAAAAVVAAAAGRPWRVAGAALLPAAAPAPLPAGAPRNCLLRCLLAGPQAGGRCDTQHPCLQRGSGRGSAEGWSLQVVPLLPSPHACRPPTQHRRIPKPILDFNPSLPVGDDILPRRRLCCRQLLPQQGVRIRQQAQRILPRAVAPVNIRVAGGVAHRAEQGQRKEGRSISLRLGRTFVTATSDARKSMKAQACSTAATSCSSKVSVDSALC